MKRIAIALMVAMLVSLAVVGVAAAQWPPYYYAGWQDCFPPGCIPPYHASMYGDYARWAPTNIYNINYTYNNYNYTYNNYSYRYDYDYRYNWNYLIDP
jgi:hypothetical protein